jgi:hypothetical protein
MQKALELATGLAKSTRPKGAVARLYTSDAHPNVLVVDGAWNSADDSDKFWAAFNATPESAPFWAKWNELVEGDAPTEQWNLVELR